MRQIELALGIALILIGVGVVVYETYTIDDLGERGLLYLYPGNIAWYARFGGVIVFVFGVIFTADSIIDRPSLRQSSSNSPGVDPRLVRKRP